jgi:hypothetical protein
MTLVKEYNVAELPGRVEFVVDLFKIIIWVLSLTAPVEGFHLVPGLRRKTRNGHHVTLLANGIIKEWGRTVDMTFINKVYSAKLAWDYQWNFNHNYQGRLYS